MASALRVSAANFSNRAASVVDQSAYILKPSVQNCGAWSASNVSLFDSATFLLVSGSEPGGLGGGEGG
jgi:hypothetical protein